VESNAILQGLSITVAGMALVFLALGLVVLAIQIMGRTFRPRPLTSRKESLPEADSAERARVAAIAAAIILTAQERPHHPDDAWRLAGHTKTSPWQTAHRTRMSARRTN
jgi:sodium pump decarboxylase gamma subunit